MPSKDINVRRETSRRWRERNRKKEIERKEARRIEISNWYKYYKCQFKCVRCGESESICIEFHHINPLDKMHKKNEVSIMVHNCCSKENIINEISKCISLCVNCHRLQTLNEHPVNPTG